MDEQESNLEGLRQSIEDGEQLAEKLKKMIADLDKAIEQVEDTLRKDY